MDLTEVIRTHSYFTHAELIDTHSLENGGSIDPWIQIMTVSSMEGAHLKLMSRRKEKKFQYGELNPGLNGESVAS